MPEYSRFAETIGGDFGHQYAATPRATAVVWIAERFTDEHRKAIEWIDYMAAGTGGLRLVLEEVRKVLAEDYAKMVVERIVFWGGQELRRPCEKAADLLKRPKQV